VSAEPPALRASDAERHQTVEELRRQAGEGRLTLEELAQRIDAVYASRTRDELDRVTADLPETTAGVPASAPRRRPTRSTSVLFGYGERTGRWRLRERLRVVVGFGDADIDLRNAQIDGSEATITAWVAFGNVDFYVPEAVDVDHGGLAIFGARGDYGTDAVPSPDAPLLRIRVYTIFGNSDLWRIPAGVKGTYRELIQSVRQARKLGAG
jgi:Domain of unknown function (DUF1707)/Cell wall-active antibiotics response 4TMS YvqF